MSGAVEMSPLKALLHFFNKREPKRGELKMGELKGISKEDRDELGNLALAELRSLGIAK